MLSPFPCTQFRLHLLCFYLTILPILFRPSSVVGLSQPSSYVTHDFCRQSPQLTWLKWPGWNWWVSPRIAVCQINICLLFSFSRWDLWVWESLNTLNFFYFLWVLDDAIVNQLQSFIHILNLLSTPDNCRKKNNIVFLWTLI